MSVFVLALLLLCVYISANIHCVSTSRLAIVYMYNLQSPLIFTFITV